MVQVGRIKRCARACASLRRLGSRVVAVLLCFFVMHGLEIKAQSVLQRLGMNTNGDDFSATLSADGTEMYYTLEEAGKQRVMRSAREGSEFGKGKEVVLIPSVKVQHIGAPTLSGDGQYMVFAALLTEHSGYGRTDLYSARKVNGVWTDIRNLGVTVNSDGWDSQPCLSPDGSTLYFSSDRDNGKGGTDVYRCKRAGNAWLNAEPMPGINTNDDEMSPTITADNRRLYFSSKRLTGMGGFDLYVCALNNDSAGGATMLAAPINSVFNDYALAMSAIGGYACLSSDRPGGAGNIDIYSVPASALPEQHVVVVRGSIERSDTNMRTVPWISVYSLDDSRPPIDVRVDDESGEYKTVVELGHRYAITSWETDAIIATKIIDVVESERGSMRTVSLNQVSVSDGAEVPLLMGAEDRRGSDAAMTHIELRRIAEVLSAHPDLRVNVILPASHGSDTVQADGQSSMQRLGQSVRSYLNLRGIPLSSVTMKVRETPAAESAEGSTNGIDEPVIVQFVKDNK